MLSVKLTEKERNELIEGRNTRNSGLSERCFFVLLSDEGKSVFEIAKQTGRDEHTVRHWLKMYREQGIIGLRGCAPPGRPAKKTSRIYPIILEVVPKSPTEYGYLEEGWTINLIKDHLKKQGIDVGASTIKRALKKNGWVYKRFSKTTPGNAPSDEKKKERIAQIIEDIKKDQKEHDVEVFFVDESHFSNEPYVQKGWLFIKENKKVSTPAKREKKTIVGALDLETKKFYWKEATKGDSKTFIEFLRQIRKSFPNQLIVLILDNSRIHKNGRVKKFLTSNPWVKLEFLTPYSPEYNPIERFWQWLKRKVYGVKSFRFIEEIVSRIRKLIWHYNENWLIASIKFNFEVYTEII